MDTHTIRTSVHHGLKRFLLIRGTILALIGMGLLLYSGIFIGAETLGNWGFVIFLISIVFIGWGLVPYKRVAKLETSPNSLIINDKGEMHYLRHGHDLVVYPTEAIEKVEFFEEKGLYGIGVTFSPEWKNKVPNPPISIVGQMFRIPMKAHHQYDQFFPYFSKRGYQELVDCL